MNKNMSFNEINMSKRETVNVDLEVWGLLNDYFNRDAEFDHKAALDWLIDQGASYKALLLMGYKSSDINVLTDDQLDVLFKLALKTKMDCWFRINADTREIINFKDNMKVLDTKEALDMFNDGVKAYPLDYEYYELTEKEQKVYQTLIAKWLNGEQS